MEIIRQFVAGELDKEDEPMTSVAAKADYVRSKMREDRVDGHHCHWPGCDRKVPPAMLGCKTHWFKLPATLRSRIWRSYRVGQEDSKTPSREYIEAAQDVQRWIAQQGA